MLKKISKDRVLRLISAATAALFVLSPILFNYVGKIGGLHVTGAALVVGLIFALMDVVTNNWGKQIARQMTVNNVVIRAVLYLLIMPLIFLIPPVSVPAGFMVLAMGSFRAFLGSEVNFFISQYFSEIPLLSYLRTKLKMNFTLSAILAMIPTEILASTVFVTIALLGSPLYLKVLCGMFVVSITKRILLLPLAYALNKAVQKYTE